MSVIKYKDSNGNYVKIPANVGINNVVEGYYNETDNEFYEESTYETEITGESSKIYISLDTDKSYYWDGSEYKLLSGGGSGHTIQDYESTDMTARTNLQFGESLNVTDDSENDATVVDEYELTDADIEEILSELPSPLSGSNKGCIPCGKVEAFYRETAPDGYLVCDGTEYAKADYPKLASILLGLTEHTQYEGSDSDHFKVPDLRGEFLRGSGTNSHTNQGSGAAVGVHQDGTGLLNVIDKTNNVEFKNIDSTDGTKTINYKSAQDQSYDATYNTSRPTNTSVLFCIAYKDIFLTTELPVLFDERRTEQPIGKYVRSDGKWKPVYRKCIVLAGPYTGEIDGIDIGYDSSTMYMLSFYINARDNVYNNVYMLSDTNKLAFIQEYTPASAVDKLSLRLQNKSIKDLRVSYKYTKTTDEWR